MTQTARLFAVAGLEWEPRNLAAVYERSVRFLGCRYDLWAFGEALLQLERDGLAVGDERGWRLRA